MNTGAVQSRLLWSICSMKSGILLYILCVVSLHSLGSNCSGSKSPLYLLSLLPYPDPRPLFQPSWDEGPTLFLAEQLAVEHINQRNDILQNHTIVLIQGDSGCNIEQKALLAFVDQLIHSRHPIAGVVGPGCSTSAAAVSPLIGHDEVALINIHIAGSLQLANRMRYPNSFSTLDSTEVFVKAAVALITHNQWTQVAALYDESRVYYYTTLLEFERQIKQLPSSRLAFSSAVYNTFLPLQIIKREFLRIIFLFVGPDFLSKVFCLAHHWGLTYPFYQWVIISRTAEEITATSLVYQGKTYSCSTMDIKQVVNGSIIIHYQLETVLEDSTSLAGVSYNDFVEQYLQKIDEYNAQSSEENTIAPSFWVASYYDAVWALALALNNSLEELRLSNLSLAGYHYGQSDITRIIKGALLNLSFHGLSGLISFKRHDGYTSRAVNIYQIWNKQATLVAYYFNGKITHVGQAHCIHSNFEQIPVAAVSPELAVLALIAVGAALLLTVLVNILTVRYRKYSSVKATSPQLTYIAFAGCYLTILAEVMYTVSMAFTKNPDTRCIPNYIWRGAIHLGFTLILGTISTRAWRLYRIFVYFRNPGKLLSNKALVSVITALIVVDVIIITAWFIADPLKPVGKSREVDTSTTTDTQPHIITRVKCTQEHSLVWLASLMGYNQLLTTAALWITLKSRHIPNKLFKTSSLSLLVYMVSLVTGVGHSLYIVLSIRDDPISEFVILSTVIITVTYLTIFLLFLPPLIPLIYQKFPLSKNILLCHRA